MNKTDALIVVDIQNDFCQAGALAVPGADSLYVLHVTNMMARFSMAGAAVVLTQDYHTDDQISFASNHPGREPFQNILTHYGQQTLWPDHCVIGTAGAAFHHGLETELADMIVRKGFRSHIDSYSGFLENDKTTKTGLSGYLRDRGIERVFICGLAYDFCVGYTALDANDGGFDTYVIEDMCRAIDLNSSKEAMRQQLLKNNVFLISSGYIK